MIFVSPLQRRHGDDWPYSTHSCFLYSDNVNSGELEVWVLEKEPPGLKLFWIHLDPFPHFEITESIRDYCIFRGAIEADTAHFVKTVALWKSQTKEPGENRRTES